MRASYDAASGTATVSARVGNLARRAGTTVVQLYLGSPAQGEPPKQLKGYAKVELGPRSRRVVTFRVGAGDLAYFDAGAGWTVAPGRYDATVVGIDPVADLAVIKLDDAKGLEPATFADSSKLNVGDTAVAIGAPLGLAGTVSSGIVM